MATATWIVLNGSIGIFGNLLTLCAVPYAKHRQRFGFRPGWDGTSIAIMNLAFADALYCAFCAPFYTYQAYIWELSSNTVQL